ncbi:MAG: hypothetical protein AB4042_19380 [Leptolyngbyaceae cyanobacterium]
MQWTSGQRLQNDRYTITKVLGEGGFGITYLSDSKEYGQVVIKTVNDTVQNRPDFDEFQDDFVNESLRMSRCQHRHIVKVHEMFREKVPNPNPSNIQSRSANSSSKPFAQRASGYFGATPTQKFATQSPRQCDHHERDGTTT